MGSFFPAGLNQRHAFDKQHGKDTRHEMEQGPAENCEDCDADADKRDHPETASPLQRGLRDGTQRQRRSRNYSRRSM
jgi:hypothetical protein